jgi:hypothetical protein
VLFHESSLPSPVRRIFSKETADFMVLSLEEVSGGILAPYPQPSDEREIDLRQQSRAVTTALRRGIIYAKFFWNLLFLINLKKNPGST